MRKLILSVLLAGVAAAPAVAQRADRSDREQARAERQQEREDRAAAREAREERQAREERAERAERRRDGVEAAARADVRAEARAGRADLEQIRAARQARTESRDSVRTWRADERQQLRERRQADRQLRQSDRAVPPVFRNRVPVVSQVPRVGTQPPLRAEQRRSSPVNWSSHWRRNNRYDWYNWRNRHRSLFRLGFYMDPFGWGYQPYSIGWRMWPSYYRSSYWLNDPWQYRLPYAPAGTRWIRYYDDAILVDTWDGQVIDVIHNFFW